MALLSYPPQRRAWKVRQMDKTRLDASAEWRRQVHIDEQALRV
jgi:hypothetical protein